jgi:hypothetical protein
VLSGDMLSTGFIPDTEEVTRSIPVSPTVTKRPLMPCDNTVGGRRNSPSRDSPYPVSIPYRKSRRTPESV